MQTLSHNINKWILCGLFICVEVLHDQHLIAREVKDQQPKAKQPNYQQAKDLLPKYQQAKDLQPKAQYPKDQHPEDQQPKYQQSKYQQPKAQYPKDQHPKDQHPKDQHPEDQQQNDQQPKAQQPKTQPGIALEVKNQPGAGADIQRLIEEIDGLIHKYGLYKDSLNWKQIYNEINTLSFTETDTTIHRLVLNIFTQNLRKAGDKHSFFITTTAAKRSSKREEKAAKPTARYLGSGIGLIRVPLCFNDQKAKDIRYANTIREQIRKVDTRNNISVWMIDLRNNVGGNMWPMLAGLNALIDDGTVGYFITPASKSEQPWPSYNGRLMFPNAKINNYKVRGRDIKIALLIDSMTASSGEMTAISFIGMPNVKVLGQPSAGYTTANTTYYLSDGTMFNLATSYIADRNRKAYMDKIIPDIMLTTRRNSGVEEAVKIMKNWILQNEHKMQ